MPVDKLTATMDIFSVFFNSWTLRKNIYLKLVTVSLDRLTSNR